MGRTFVCKLSRMSLPATLILAKYFPDGTQRILRRLKTFVGFAIVGAVCFFLLQSVSDCQSGTIISRASGCQ